MTLKEKNDDKVVLCMYDLRKKKTMKNSSYSCTTSIVGNLHWSCTYITQLQLYEIYIEVVHVEHDFNFVDFS